MKKIYIMLAVAALAGGAAPEAHAQFNINKIVSAASKGIQALTLSDEQVAALVKESVDYMDANNQVMDASSPYTKRLAKLTAGLKDVDGVPLNFKVYNVTDVNAFACADGSVRVFRGIMDLMTDDELLGVIGHEVGHVGLHHSRNQMKHELMNGALKDLITSKDGTIARLTDSQLGQLAGKLGDARYSQKQEKEADDYGYNFLKEHGKNPWGMVMAFEKLESIEQQGGSAQSYFAKMFSTHPDTKERIERMIKKAQSDGIERPSVTPEPAKTTKKTATKPKSKKKRR